MIERAAVVLAGVLAIAMVAAGCGGGGDDSTDAGSEVTKAAFIKQADAICAKGNESIESEASEFAEENDIDIEKATTDQQEEVVSDVVAPGIRTQAEEIDAVGAPSGDEEEVEAIVEAVESGADEAEASPNTIVEGSEGGPFAKANELATEYGLKVCGSE